MLVALSGFGRKGLAVELTQPVAGEAIRESVGPSENLDRRETIRDELTVQPSKVFVVDAGHRVQPRNGGDAPGNDFFVLAGIIIGGRIGRVLCDRHG